ncbi:acetyl-CoA carboxylase biotin carboxyl carrier protein subunit [Bacillus sp. FJAT-47783]|uniref:acetyl-CoA carboxylase biotin carboxyl carrier protein subunit n=1 Tax=Bacillus sp. FJAT-47783 TaxID=2922712 RepID=UPI001FACC473|nr:acetyl-CoA carboxylase biotin carboxyl carrier protein subunit [Bacillus sp. FJAT-47783]
MREIKATMAGTVLNVMVSKGDVVSTGQDVLMLESMKMEIPIQSEVSGTVEEMKVQIGDFVNEGDVLAIISS